MPLKIIAQKFNAYISFTQGLTRSVPVPAGTWFIYPHDSLISDLVTLWAFLTEMYEALGKSQGFEAHLDANPDIKKEFNNINLNGEFWSSATGTLSRVAFVDVKLGQLARTLRNHSRTPTGVTRI
jgi:hypothetical protein